MGRSLNNWAMNSHLPFRRRARAMLRFRHMRTLRKFASIHASVHNYFPTECHLQMRDHYKLTRTAVLSEWHGLLAAKTKAAQGQRRLVRVRLTAPPPTPVSLRILYSGPNFCGVSLGWRADPATETPVTTDNRAVSATRFCGIRNAFGLPSFVRI